MNCRICGVELNDSNWYPSCQKKRDYICKTHQKEKASIRQKSEVGKEYHHMYYLNHKEERSVYDKQNYEKKRLQKRRQQKEYYDINRGTILNQKRDYRKTPKGKDSVKRRNIKHERELGFIPLNEKFNNSEFHHTDFNNGIYVPEEYNKIVPHNIHTGKNMEIVNTYAYFFLLMQNIDKLIEVY